MYSFRVTVFSSYVDAFWETECMAYTTGVKMVDIY